MKIWTRKYLDLELLVDPPYSIKELAAFQELKDSPPKGFSIRLTNLVPYDTEEDLRLKTPAQRKRVDEFLRTHNGLGINFEEYDPKEDTKEISAARLKELEDKEKLADEVTAPAG